MLRTSRFAIALVVLLTAAAPAQMTHVIPFGAATVPGNSSNTFPWGTTGGGFPGIRILACYDNSNFLNAGINQPITITRLRWRADNNTASWTGGTFDPATVRLSTAAVNWNAVSMNWGVNHGPDVTLCHTGPVTVQPSGGGAPGVGPFTVDAQLTLPFVYDPTAGDLIIDTDWQNGAFSGGTVPILDVATQSTTLASRVYGSSAYPAANGAELNHGIVVEVTYYPPGSNIATVASYGEGCYDRFATFYELFPAGTFDLANQGIRLLPSGSGYAVVPGATGWFTPTSAPLTFPLSFPSMLSSGPHTLPFSFPFPGGATSTFHVGRFGAVWARPTPNPGCCQGSVASLLADLPRFAGFWTNLNLLAGGSAHLDLDPANNAAYVTFLNVPESNSTNLNTFQMAFFANGGVEYRYQQCAASVHATLVGWSPGLGARDPGNADLSSLPISTAPDAVPLRLVAEQRPLINTSVTVTARDIPPQGLVGAFVGGLVQHLPGLSLASFGMPGCLQHASHDASAVLIAAGGGQASMTLAVPNDPGLSGVSVFLQAVVLVPGANQLGALSSNGLDLRVGTQ